MILKLDKKMEELDIEELKKIMLDGLKYLNFICNRENIKYYIAYGTLIGTIRHKVLFRGMMT